ncbi:phosphopentomutase [Anaeromyxobacter oryzae]|uniref:Phosphopentomutase n=1 Tax=Anaeromyxobacter oryzae TaxID=2918170 RepID=A0ABN6MVQ5_9BACT|nr:phosphopentomutase [Anaeromyxobacter oryzae]BDG04606.1 phosphopentomutase [Anaeromyxobacter oryzae]
MDRRRFVILVADSAGCGALPDARAYGDEGSDTIGNTSRAVGGLALPTLGRMGLGHVTAIQGVPPDPRPAAFHGRMAERSQGKDTITGHWEMMGIVLQEGLATFPRGFPPEIVEPFVRETGVPGVLGNVAASGTEIIQRLGEEHQRTGKPIVYTSADSVFQIAAHEETVPLETLYAWCHTARRLLDRFRVARVIARPFVGAPGKYVRTYHRKDFSIATPGRTVLEKLVDARVPVIGVGKIPDIFDRKGITEEIHTEGNADGLAKTEALLERVDHGLVFVNLVDFDMLYGHRNDPVGYARALEELDRALPRLVGKLRPGELLALTADHGCDPTTPSTDHSREYVPLVVHAADGGGGSLGTRGSFADLGATVADYFGVPVEVGTSFLPELRR